MSSEARHARRCHAIPVPRDLSIDIRAARDGAGIAWLAVFEDELSLALAEYVAHHEAGTRTPELADYIAYLDECVTCLSAGSEAGLDALASIERFARVRNTTPA